MRYTAILKAKEGELIALSKGGVPSETRILLERNKKPLGKRPTLRLVEALRSHGRGVFCIDYSAHDKGTGEAFRNDLKQLPLAVRPNVSVVISPDSKQSLIDAACQQSGRSGLLVVRIASSGLGSAVRSLILQFVGGLPVPRQKIAIVLDFANLGDVSVASFRSQILEAAGPLVMKGGFESVTVSGTSFPDGIGKIIAAKNWKVLARPEFDAWRSAVESSGMKIGFGDYGPRSASHPPDGRANTLAQVRYTFEGGFRVYRGLLLRNDHGQLRTIGSTLMSSSIFKGSDYSWGDGELQRIGSGTGGTGNRTTWISIETSHHLNFTAEQVSDVLDF